MSQDQERQHQSLPLQDRCRDLSSHRDRSHSMASRRRNGRGLSHFRLLIPENAHIRLANPTNNSGQRILRRGYSYSESPEPGTGQIDAGLFFIAFQRDPERQFIPLQRRLAANDALNRHTLHTSSAIFACPPGASPGGFIGDALFS